MFTGIIQAKGVVASSQEQQLRIQVHVIPEDWEPWKVGESVAVNGICLTVVGASDGIVFDVSPETYARTTLGGLKLGSHVNLERAMRANDRFGGHLVQGHVDAVGELISIEAQENSSVYRFAVPLGYDRYLVDKGSISVEGISLTVVRPKGLEFETWLIPHTLEFTALGSLTVGDQVNLEFDAMAKYAEKLLKSGGE